jgi:hypothetical protein
MAFNKIRRSTFATQRQYAAFEIYAADIYKQIIMLLDMQDQELPWARDGAPTTFSPPMLHVIENHLKDVEKSEEGFRELGHKLLHASDREAVDAATVDKIFGLLPRLIEHMRLAQVFIQRQVPHAHSLPMDTQHLQPMSDGATLVIPATSPHKFDDLVKCETPLGSIVRPFWSGGRWHVAVRRACGDTVIVDPWGEYDCKESHVGSILQYVMWACVLTSRH